MGRAINKTSKYIKNIFAKFWTKTNFYSHLVTIAEILKRRVEGLHQTTAIDSTEITDIWEPLEEGLDR